MNDIVSDSSYSGGFFARRLPWILISIALLCASIGLTPVTDPALAHNVSVFAWVDGDTVHVESKFSGGRRPHNASIEVYDADGHLLLNGKTDSEGAFSFTPPQQTDLRIVLVAGMGHRAEWTVRADEFSQSSAGPSPSDAGAKAPARPAAAEITASQAPPPAATTPSDGGLSADQVRELVEDALDRKLKPVMKLLSETRQSGPSLSDILGGIGYILGLVGLGAYIQFKRSRKSPNRPPGKRPS